MKTKNDKWLAELQNEIGRLDSISCDAVARLKITLPLISQTISDLRKEVLQNGFACEADEIYFFKHIKPQFYALQIYEVDLYNVLMNKPAGTSEMLRDYYEQELLYIIRLYRIHAFHYQYFRMFATELDGPYFTRAGKPAVIPVLEGIDIDPGFTTPLDYLFAKFIAAGRYQEYLLEQLSGQIRLPAKPARQAPQLRWTGETINLVEIAYGIWLTRQLNDGEASVSEIVRFLEEIFGIRIGDAHRRWQEIAQRKSISPTKYLDLMISEITQRIDNERNARRKKTR